ncbi:cyclohexyl-isocyanide hydratase [Entomortierella parvispora]|uniref:Cyclohexyl-isocyanide hydratase n=1 Tax=Entomortierella parvispora TaxID=205924 RepID=A0A9P3H6M4_9FUNG|nr:cyclohexyl-isocyanide hydratase [Entomortierella parvispora]
MVPPSAPHGPFPKIPSGSGKLRLGAVVFNGMDLLDVMGPMRIFGEESNKLDIEICFISSTLDPIRSSQQVMVTPHYTIENAPKLDLLFLPGGIGTRTYTDESKLLQLIKERAEAATWVMTVCTGAAIAAKTGLFDGYNMTTNKSAFEWPMTQGPKVNWIKKARWVQDGKIVSSSGVSAGIDAALYIVQELVDKATAEAVAAHIEYTWHRDANDDPFAEMYPFTRSA